MNHLRRTLVLALAAACSAPAADAPSGNDTEAATFPGEDFELVAVDKAHVFFTGEVNARSVDVEATFPPSEATYASLRLEMRVACPAGGRCDPWDRLAYLGVVLDKGTEAERLVELTRFITPYGVGDRWSLDVTDLRPLLSGRVDLRVFVDTWVGPGSSYGDGWQVTARFVGTGGPAPREVLGVLPVYAPTYVAYGDPARPTSDQLPTAEIPLPPGTASVALRAFITGHGQGNAANCAEFCAKEHTLHLGEASVTRELWRDDCATTGAPDQQGSWTYGRAGWCPGAEVLPWIVEEAVSGATSLTAAWEVAPFENTCRPDAPTCTDCVLGTGCEYDGGAHTEPNYQVGAALIAYGSAAP